jgi:hypothetical protein
MAALMSLLAATALAAVASEPLWLSLMTLIFFGLVPAFAFFVLGCLMRWALCAVISPLFERSG